MSKLGKIVKRLLIGIGILMLVGVFGFLIWANDYYHAEPEALSLYEAGEMQEFQKNVGRISPQNEGKTGIIFYPGAKVEAISYLPILSKLTDQGYTCFLVEMPFNMAIFNSDAADQIIEQADEIENWYIAGHSMGGAMASNYASKNQEKIEGLILLGAYVYGDYPVEKSLTIYGSLNDSLEKNMDYTENIVKIEGGNHAQFGNYGKQKGDEDATISAEEQQNQAVEAISQFAK